VVCLVNDYGPTPGTKRVIDLSRGAYSQLEGLGSGTMPVEVRRVDNP
jgi:rare lipoprotein A (peptidoglycan hydrolase)